MTDECTHEIRKATPAVKAKLEALPPQLRFAWLCCGRPSLHAIAWDVDDED